MAKQARRITYAIARADDPKRVALWVQGRKNAGGALSFEVLNGGWTGTISTDGVLLCKQTKETWPALIIWQGEVPEKQTLHYTDAILWIQEQVNGR